MKLYRPTDPWEPRVAIDLAVTMLRAARCLLRGVAPRAWAKTRVALASAEAALRYHDHGIKKGAQ